MIEGEAPNSMASGKKLVDRHDFTSYDEIDEAFAPQTPILNE